MGINVNEGKLSLLKNCLNGASVLCLLAGLGMLGGCIFLYVDKSDLLTFVYLMNTARPACILMLAAVSTTVVIAIMGFVAASVMNKRLLLAVFYYLKWLCETEQSLIRSVVAQNLQLYGIIVILAGMAAGACLGCAINGRVRYNDYIRWLMRTVVLENYGVNVTTNAHNAFLTEKWDEAQRKWYCCSVDDSSWGLYRSSIWFQFLQGNPEYDRPLVPQSCCTYNQYGQLIDLQKCQIWADGPPRKQSSQQPNEALLYKGCYTHGTYLLQQVSTALIAISIVLIFILIGCLVIAIMMIMGLKTRTAKQAVIRQNAYSISKQNPAFNCQPGAYYNNSYA